MPPPLSAQENGLFHGMTFWLGLKIPFRNALRLRIIDNGGSVVPREEDADMLLADPKNKNPRSYLHYFVEDALKAGRLPDKNAYLINPGEPTGTQRMTRIPFTAEDKVELISWVLTFPSHKRSGNKLYQDLAARNPRHTAQSWRDNFVKGFKNCSDDKLRALEKSYGAGRASSSQPAQRQTHDPPPAIPKRSGPTSGRGTPSSSTKPSKMAKSRNAFTEEEDAALLKALGDQRQPKRSWFDAFAIEHPTHSQRAWYNHWIRILKPRLNSEETHREQPSAAPTSKSPKNRADSEPGASDQNVSPSPPIVLTSRDEPPDEEEAEQKETFFKNLDYFMRQQNRLNDAVDLKPKIGEEVVDLYQLFVLVDRIEKKLGHMNVGNWAEIAVGLGIDCVKNPSAPLKTKKLWDVYLDEFANTLESDDEEEHTDADEEGNAAKAQSRLVEAEVDEDANGEQEVCGETPPPLPSTGRKRDLEHEDWEHPLKRVKRSRDDEIAATPVSRLEGMSQAVASPSLAAPSPSGQTRPQPRSSTPITPTVIDDESDENNITPSQQLHNEDAAVTPIPLRLADSSSSRRPKRSGSASTQSVELRALDEAPARDEGMSQLSSECERLESLGYSGVDIKAALRATTLDIGLAGYVVEHYLNQKKQLPTNVEGVWTESDDDGLRFVDELPQRSDSEADRRKRNLELARLVKKHTLDRVKSRREYLALAGELTGRR